MAEGGEAQAASKGGRRKGRWCTDHDCVRSVLGLAVVLGGGLLLALVWFVPVGGRDPNGFLSAILAVISGVLGWYFGSKGVDAAQKAVAREEEVVQRYAAELGDVLGVLEKNSALLKLLKTDPAVADKVNDLLARMEGESDG